MGALYAWGKRLGMGEGVSSYWSCASKKAANSVSVGSRISTGLFLIFSGLLDNFWVTACLIATAAPAIASWGNQGQEPRRKQR
ncbi:hypothetical protein ACLRGI_06080 [Paenarthrobacter nitroguajacolicus]|uniref:hypothetical protein n=1 Tax=Paenarthrobacter nitroguajacolicus TaxID=211146 RepID=UPI003AEBEB68